MESGLEKIISERRGDGIKDILSQMENIQWQLNEEDLFENYHNIEMRAFDEWAIESKRVHAACVAGFSGSANGAIC